MVKMVVKTKQEPEAALSLTRSQIHWGHNQYLAEESASPIRIKSIRKPTIQKPSQCGHRGHRNPRNRKPRIQNKAIRSQITTNDRPIIAIRSHHPSVPPVPFLRTARNQGSTSSHRALYVAVAKIEMKLSGCPISADTSAPGGGGEVTLENSTRLRPKKQNTQKTKKRSA